MTVRRVWQALSLGLILIAAAFIVNSGVLSWLLVLLAASSFVNALVKKRWRFAPHPLLWALGMAWAIRDEEINGFAMFLGLCGVSFVVSQIIALIPARHAAAPPPVPPRHDPARRSGPVLDAEVTSRED